MSTPPPSSALSPDDDADTAVDAGADAASPPTPAAIDADTDDAGDDTAVSTADADTSTASDDTDDGDADDSDGDAGETIDSDGDTADSDADANTSTTDADGDDDDTTDSDADADDTDDDDVADSDAGDTDAGNDTTDDAADSDDANGAAGDADTSTADTDITDTDAGDDTTDDAADSDGDTTSPPAPATIDANTDADGDADGDAVTTDDGDTDSDAADTTADADADAAASPLTPAAELARIATYRPDLHAVLATNPSTSPGLVDWLRQSEDPAVHAALAARFAHPGTPMPPPPPTAPVPPPPAASAPPPPTPSAPSAPLVAVPAPPPPTGAAAPAVYSAPVAASAPSSLPALPPGAGTPASGNFVVPGPQAAGYTAAAPQMAPPQPPPAAPAPPRRRVSRPVIITVVVLVAILVISGAVVLGMHLLRGDSANGSTAPSNSWAEGAHKVWDMDIDERSIFIGNKDQLVVADMDSDYTITTVSAYDVSGDKPKKQWSTDPHTDSLYLSYWGEYVVIGDMLIKADTGETTDAPWHKNPIIVGDYAFSCGSKDLCTGWSAAKPNQELWKTNVSGSSDFQDIPSLNGSVYQGNGKLIVQAAESTWIDVITGEIYDFDTTRSEIVFALADGWCKYNYEKEQFTILSPTGEKRDTFNGDYPEDVSAAATLDHPRLTAAEFKSFIQDKDLSWAKIKITRTRNSSSDCPTKLTIGESTFKPVNDSGSCYEPDGIVLYSLSSNESVLMRVSADPTSTSTGMWISGAWTVKDGETIDFPGNDFDSGTVFYLVNPELIVARETSDGELTAYRPGAK
ncbi:hypothetical protein [uncultured Actinomyces sp.]|uniref:variant leucine-rich repeat-containing protein n=1 Tax=uncultured Actinomyces sp. TaxID=249061 RepID=UPI00288B5208|nr:hypothetical protein [uncultured Actinomyces sp.]